jgi:hypothetical protein
MSTTTKKVLLLIAMAIAAYLVLKIVLHIALGLIWNLLPFALVGGAVYVLYVAYGRKALGGGRRTLP